MDDTAGMLEPSSGSMQKPSEMDEGIAAKAGGFLSDSHSECLRRARERKIQRGQERRNREKKIGWSNAPGKPLDKASTGESSTIHQAADFGNHEELNSGFQEIKHAQNLTIRTSSKYGNAYDAKEDESLQATVDWTTDRGICLSSQSEYEVDYYEESEFQEDNYSIPGSLSHSGISSSIGAVDPTIVHEQHSASDKSSWFGKIAVGLALASGRKTPLRIILFYVAAIYLLLSFGVWFFFMWIGFPIGLLTAPASLIILVIVVFWRPHLLAPICCWSVNFWARFMLGLDLSIEIEGISLAQLQVEQVSVFLSQERIFNVDRIDIKLSFLENIFAASDSLMRIVVGDISVSASHMQLMTIARSFSRFSEWRKKKSERLPSNPKKAGFARSFQILNWLAVQIDQASCQLRFDKSSLRIRLNKFSVSASLEKMKSIEQGSFSMMNPRLSFHEILVNIEEDEFVIPFLCVSQFLVFLKPTEVVRLYSVVGCDCMINKLSKCGEDVVSGVTDITGALSDARVEIGKVDFFFSQTHMQLLSLCLRVLCLADRKAVAKTLNVEKFSPQQPETEPSTGQSHPVSLNSLGGYSASDEREVLTGVTDVVSEYVSSNDTDSDPATWSCRKCGMNNTSTNACCSVCGATVVVSLNEKCNGDKNGSESGMKVKEFRNGENDSPPSNRLDEDLNVVKSTSFGGSTLLFLECILASVLQRLPERVSLHVNSLQVSLHGESFAVPGAQLQPFGGGIRFLCAVKILAKVENLRPSTENEKAFPNGYQNSTLVTPIEDDGCSVYLDRKVAFEGICRNASLSIAPVSLEKLASEHRAVRSAVSFSEQSKQHRSDVNSLLRYTLVRVKEFRVSSSIRFALGDVAYGESRFKSTSFNVDTLAKSIGCNDGSSAVDAKDNPELTTNSKIALDTNLPKENWECTHCATPNSSSSKSCSFCGLPFVSIREKERVGILKKRKTIRVLGGESGGAHDTTSSEDIRQLILKRAPFYIKPYENHHHDVDVKLSIFLSGSKVKTDVSLIECVSSVLNVFNLIENQSEKDNEQLEKPVSGGSRKKNWLIGVASSYAASIGSREMDSNRSCRYLSGLWFEDESVVSIRRSIAFDLKVASFSATICPPRKEFSIFQDGEVRPCGVHWNCQKFQFSSTLLHKVPLAESRHVYQHVDLESTLAVGPTQLCQVFSGFEANQKRFVSKVQQPTVLERQEQDAATQSQTGSEFSLAKILHIPETAQLVGGARWRKTSDSLKQTNVCVDGGGSYKLYLFCGTLIRIFALFQEHNVAISRFFPSATSRTLSKAGKHTSKYRVLNLDDDVERFPSGTKDRLSNGNQGPNLRSTVPLKKKDVHDTKPDVRLRFCLSKGEVFLYANHQLEPRGHVMIGTITDLKLTMSSESQVSCDVPKLSLELAKTCVAGKIIGKGHIFATSSLVSTISKQVLKSPELLEPSTYCYCILFEFHRLHIRQGPKIELGDAIASILQQKKAVKEALRRIQCVVDGKRALDARHFESGSGLSRKALLSDGKGMTGRTKLDIKLRIDEACVYFLQTGKNWVEHPELNRYKPKSNTMKELPLVLIKLENGDAEAKWDSIETSRKNLLDIMWQLDDVPDLQAALNTYNHGFSFVLGGILSSLNVKRLVFQLRNHCRPLVEAWDLSLARHGEIVLGEIVRTSACMYLSNILLSQAPPSEAVMLEKFFLPLDTQAERTQSKEQHLSSGVLLKDVPRGSVPVKLYYSLDLVCKKLNVVFGECLFHTLKAFDEAIGRMIPKKSDTISPKLPFWDKIRYMFHGLLSLKAQNFSLRLLTFSPWHSDTGLLIQGSNVELRNIRERNIFNRGENVKNSTRYQFESVPENSVVMSSRYILSSESVNVDEDHESASVDWGSLTQPISDREDWRNSSDKHKSRDWEIVATRLVISTVKDLKSGKVEQSVLVSSPLARVKVAFVWGNMTNLDHYVQFHHKEATSLPMIQDMFKRFRSKGLEVALFFELGCLPAGAEELTTDGKRTDTDSITRFGALGRDCNMPALFLCWESYIALSDIRRAFTKRSFPRPSPHLARLNSLVTKFNINVLVDQLRVLWWEEPKSEAALFVHACSFVTKIGLIRNQGKGPSSDDTDANVEENMEEFWDPPFGLPPPWSVDGLLLQCQHLSGYFIPRDNEAHGSNEPIPEPVPFSEVEYDGRVYRDASGVNWQPWRVYPVPPVFDLISFARDGDENDEPEIPEEPWVISPFLLIRSGNWMSLGLDSWKALSGQDDQDDQENTRVLTVISDGLKVTWSIGIRDAVFMVIGSTMYSLRQQWQIDEEIRREFNKKIRLSAPTSFASVAPSSPASKASSPVNNESTGRPKNKIRPNSETFHDGSDIFDSQFEKPMVNVEHCYAPLVQPMGALKDLLEQDAMQNYVGKPMMYSKDYCATNANTVAHKHIRETLESERLIGRSIAPDSPHSDEFSSLGQIDHADGPIGADMVGSLGIIVRLRWVQFQLRSAHGIAFVTGESANVESIYVKGDTRIDSNTNEGITEVTAVRRKITVSVDDAEVFIPPKDIAQSSSTSWVAIASLDSSKYSESALSSFNFSFKPLLSSKRLFNRSLPSQYWLSVSSKSQGWEGRSVLEKASFAICHVSYMIAGDDPPHAQGVRLPHSSVNVDIGKFYVSLTSYQFFSLLSVIRHLILAYPSPDYTAMITKASRRSSKNAFRWVKDVASPCETYRSEGWEDGENGLPSDSDSERSDVEDPPVANVSDSNTLGSGDNSAEGNDSFEESGELENSNTDIDEILIEPKLADQTDQENDDSEENPSLNKVYSKKWSKQVSRIVEKRNAASKRASPKSEFIYNVKHIRLTLLDDPPQKASDRSAANLSEVRPRSTSGLNARPLNEDSSQCVACELIQLRGSHLFREDNGTSVEIKLQDIRLIDLIFQQNSMPVDGEGLCILRGRSAVVNRGRPAPFLRVTAETLPYFLWKTKKVNVYKMLQILLYPNVSTHKVTLFLRADVAKFLVKYLNFGDDSNAGTEAGVNEPDSTMSSNILRKMKSYSTANSAGKSDQDRTPTVWSGWVTWNKQFDKPWNADATEVNFCRLVVFPKVLVNASRGNCSITGVNAEFRFHSGGFSGTGSLDEVTEVFDVDKIISIAYSKDAKAPKSALDITLNDPAQSKYTLYFASSSYEVDAADVDNQVVYWASAIRPLVARRVFCGPLSQKISNTGEVAERTKTIVELVGQAPSDDSSGVLKRRFFSEQVKQIEKHYVNFLLANEVQRYVLSSRKASSLGLTTKKRLRLASGGYEEVVYFQYVQISKVEVTVTLKNFPLVGRIGTRKISLKETTLRYKISSWNEFFNWLKGIYIKMALQSYVYDIVRRSRKTEDGVFTDDESHADNENVLNESSENTNSTAKKLPAIKQGPASSFLNSKSIVIRRDSL